ncbi:MAG: hypothetical protein D3906_06915, partial [Candidatus Electrothrix sp. AUS1_2]|nr:hypothetical protein [Candidatus Electrothrix sp. AUS1_2]
MTAITLRTRNLRPDNISDLFLLSSFINATSTRDIWDIPAIFLMQKILIVDDKEQNLFTLRKVLADLDVE